MDVHQHICERRHSVANCTAWPPASSLTPSSGPPVALHTHIFAPCTPCTPCPPGSAASGWSSAASVASVTSASSANPTPVPVPTDRFLLSSQPLGLQLPALAVRADVAPAKGVALRCGDGQASATGGVPLEEKHARGRHGHGSDSDADGGGDADGRGRTRVLGHRVAQHAREPRCAHAAAPTAGCVRWCVRWCLRQRARAVDAGGADGHLAGGADPAAPARVTAAQRDASRTVDPAARPADHRGSADSTAYDPE